VTSSVAGYRRLYEVIIEALLSEEVWIEIFDEDEEIT
jgi:hypothetical protein